LTSVTVGLPKKASLLILLEHGLWWRRDDWRW